jgi:hypothetical protein
MAAPLEFKRRVRLPEFTGEPAVARRRSWATPLGALTWLVVVGLAVGIAEGVVPIERWLHVEHAPALARRSVRSERPVSASEPRPPALAPAPATAELEPDELAPASEPPALAPEEPSEPAPAAAAAALLEPDAEDLETPSIPSLAPDLPPAAAEPPAPSTAPVAVESVANAGTSCEQAAAAATQSIEIGADPGPADLTREDYQVVLDRGSYFAHCGVGEHVRIEICAAVQRGRALGVTVKTTPASPAASCIARAVRSLGFPSHPRLDVVRTRFD